MQTIAQIEREHGIGPERLRELLARSLRGESPRRALLIPPDITRLNSFAGPITCGYYELLRDLCEVDVLPALGTHRPMSRAEAAAMYPGIPFERFIAHNWRTDLIRLGEVPADYVCEISGGLFREAMDVEVNRRLIGGDYDLILSIGQVVPHEVVGMANYSKNVLVGCGGSRMINASHMLGACYGLERLMGRDHSPVRRVLDYAQEHFLAKLPLFYALTVTTTTGGRTALNGLFVAGGRAGFEQAVALSQELNLNFVDEPIQKAVVYLDPREFKSTWLGNKAVYRTRMAVANGGELLILAPGIETFGEDAAIDALIRKYGYCGREDVLRLTRENADLRENLSAAAHLIHGSSDGRFRITYCTEKISGAEVRGVRFGWQAYAEAARRYDPRTLREGWNVLADGERVYFIPNPALGLWADRNRFGASGQ